MSLLLEALKKAEKAKEEAQRRARSEAEGARGAAEGAPELRLEGESAERAVPVLTRDQLPDIRQPLEIERDEPKAKQPGPAAAPRPQVSTERKPAGDTGAGERAAARKVFEAKFKEPNPRLPFFIAMGALGVFALGTVVYFWIQLSPAPSLVNTNPPRPGGEAQVAAAGEPQAPRPGVPAAPSAIPGLPSAIPGLPGAAPAPAAPAPAAAPPPAAAPAKPAAQPEVPLIKPPGRQPATAARAVSPAETEISASRAAPQVHPKVASGYAAYVGGDLAAARADYQQVLREESSNRDALLGLAALDVRAGRFEVAEAAYLRLLQADPRDAHAHAALIALRGRRLDPVAAESRVKSMLADNPGAHVLNFTLGNQLAQQGRWAEAQQEYFKAFAAEPDNADFAYNLAVSLDHLRQPKLALEYYQRALALAKARGARFDSVAAETRAAQLGR
jgi:Flp pilus assembly protein TadD